MRKIRSSTVVFALTYVVLVVGVFLALGGAAYAADSPTSAADQYDSPVVEVVVPPTETQVEESKPPTETVVEEEMEESGPFVPPEAETEVADVETSTPSAPADTESEVVGVAQALPSTGLSLLATALIGGALLAIGVALRRRERRNG